MAPMAGITDSAFRQVCKSFGADLVYTEMVSADGLVYGSKKTLELAKFDKKEKPIILQLFGKNPESFVKGIGNQELAIKN
ncbi:tRNA-dihydrouridine synthase, partial [bacterium]|nr:tRNA-dihydrouridine synthase [bacterium]